MATKRTTKPTEAAAGPARRGRRSAAKKPAAAAADRTKPADTALESATKPADAALEPATKAAAEKTPAPAAEAPSPEDTEARIAAVTRKDLFDRITETTGVKRRFVRPVIEAVLRELGDALEAGAELHVKPFGKAKVQRSVEQANAKVLVVKLRRVKPERTPPGGEEPLAEAAE